MSALKSKHFCSVNLILNSTVSPHSSTTESLPAVWLWCEGSAGVCGRVLQRHGHIYSHTWEAQRNCLLLCSAYWLPWGLLADITYVDLKMLKIEIFVPGHDDSSWLWSGICQCPYKQECIWNHGYLYTVFLCYFSRMWTLIWRRLTRRLCLKRAVYYWSKKIFLHPRFLVSTHASGACRDSRSDTH